MLRSLVRISPFRRMSTLNNYSPLKGVVVEVEGNIASGKSRLTSRIHEAINSTSGSEMCKIFTEKVNPAFLGAFYSDPKRFAFAFQMYMLTTRLHQMEESSRLARDEGKLCLLDRGAVGDTVFAMQNRELGNMDDIDMGVYKSVCHDRRPESLSERVGVLLYLDVDPAECHRRATSVRAREAETGIPLSYLQGVDTTYFHVLFHWLGGIAEAAPSSTGATSTSPLVSYNMNFGNAPPVVVLPWHNFGELDTVLSALSAVLSGSRAKPSVEFCSRSAVSLASVTGCSNVRFSLTSADDIAHAYDKLQKTGHAFEMTASSVAPWSRPVVEVDWTALPHDNAFRRVLMHCLSLGAHVRCFT